MRQTTPCPEVLRGMRNDARLRSEASLGEFAGTQRTYSLVLSLAWGPSVTCTFQVVYVERRFGYSP